MPLLWEDEQHGAEDSGEKVKIGLIDVDGGKRFPNFALMRISSFFKQKEYTVEWWTPFEEYDEVHMSKIFTWSHEPQEIIRSKVIYRGGPGYIETGEYARLPRKVRDCFPDYSLYPDIKFAVGYFTIGCPRNCPWCVVPKIDGTDVQCVADCLSRFWDGQKVVKLMDANILAYSRAGEILTYLAEFPAVKFDFNQGLDIRLINYDVLAKLQKVNLQYLRFSWDQWKDRAEICRRLEMVKEITPSWDRHFVTVYTMVNYNTTFEQDLFRINFIHSLGFRPYVMIYDKDKLVGSKRSKYLGLSRWVNANIIQSSTWEEYGGKFRSTGLQQTINI